MQRANANCLVASPVLITLRVIAPGEQLTFDYGDSSGDREEGDHNRERKRSHTQHPPLLQQMRQPASVMVPADQSPGSSVTADDEHKYSSLQRHRCMCGSAHCRGWLPDVYSTK